MSGAHGGVHVVTAPTVVYRVAVSSRGQTFSVLDPATTDLRSGGNRFDVPGAPKDFGLTMN